MPSRPGAEYPGPGARHDRAGLSTLTKQLISCGIVVIMGRGAVARDIRDTSWRRLYVQAEKRLS